jgi:hypothetical protein
LIFDRRLKLGGKVSDPAHARPTSWQNILRSDTSNIRHTHGLAERLNAGAQCHHLKIAL